MQRLFLSCALCAVASLAAEPRAFMEKHCFECHDSETKKGGLDLTMLRYDTAKPEKWVRLHDAVAAGDTWFSDSFQKAMADALTAPESDVDAKGSTLTEREKEIAILLAKSFSSKEVAVKLEISAKTVENHRTNLMRKLGVHDVAGVIRFVVRQGFYDPSEG